MISKEKIAVSSDSGGAVTLSPSTPVGIGRMGFLHAIYVAIGTLANTVDITVTDVETGQLLLTLTNVAANALVMPRLPVHDATGAAITGLADRAPIGRLGVQVAVAQAGNTKAGTVFVFIDQGAQS